MVEQASFFQKRKIISMHSSISACRDPSRRGKLLPWHQAIYTHTCNEAGSASPPCAVLTGPNGMLNINSVAVTWKQASKTWQLFFPPLRLSWPEKLFFNKHFMSPLPARPTSFSGAHIFPAVLERKFSFLEELRASFFLSFFNFPPEPLQPPHNISIEGNSSFLLLVQTVGLAG